MFAYQDEAGIAVQEAERRVRKGILNAILVRTAAVLCPFGAAKRA